MATPKNDTPQNAEKATLAVTSDGVKAASGSQSVHFQRELLDQVTASLWLPEWKTSEQKLQAAKAAYDALRRVANLRACSQRRCSRPITPPWNPCAGR